LLDFIFCCEVTSFGWRSNKIITDAPCDNRGKGEAFSPTDLLATALGNCIMTIMGIKAMDNGFDLAGTEIEITKIMPMHLVGFQK